MKRIRVLAVLVLPWMFLSAAGNAVAEAGEDEPLRAGAAAVDISPEHLPAIINGGFLRRTADRIIDPLHARAIVLDDGHERLAIVVVDSCMVPRHLIEEARELAAEQTDIRPDRILISATHTHAAPAAMGALGCEVDANYVPLLPPRIAAAIAEANDRLEPAEIAHAIIPAPGHTAVRRWMYRPGVVHEDPFGERTVRANMHPGSQNADATGPTGPVDDDFAVLAIRAADGSERPISLLATYSMHYFGVGVAPVSADYFGVFAEKLEHELDHDEADAPPFVAMLANGTSGDLWWKDYFRPDYTREVEEYARVFVDLARDAWAETTFRSDITLAMAETQLALDRRVPDDERLAWARDIVEQVGDRPPQNRTEVYAFEQIYLDEEPTAELILQAVRIGDFAITAIPNEVYAITGLKLKHHSPIESVMNISLANGGEGYIPPPEQYDLGGYNTWPARTAALEEQAEPKIVEAVLTLIEQVADEPRRPFTEPAHPYARHVLSDEPIAYYRMGEFAGPVAHDATDNGHHAAYEPFIVFALPGPAGAGLSRDNGHGADGDINRSPHFAGGRMQVDLGELGETYSVELWLWSGVEDHHYPVTGYVFSRGPDGAEEAPGDHLGIGGNHADVPQGRLFFYNGDEAGQVVAGETRLERHRWHHAVLVREGGRVHIYLDGEHEASGEAEPTVPPDLGQVFIGGRNDNFASFPGRIDEVAVHGRALTAEEVAARYRAAEGR